ncbi:MAG: N-acetylmuramoyl-L-alanine amidase [Lachnospiraceae bacterium]
MTDLKKVLWDAGHGGSDPGAVGYVKEADVAIKVVNYAHEYLKDNYECESKKDTTSDSIRTVVDRANSWGADLFVSVHFNAGGGDGYEALVYSSKNKALGQCFEKQVKAVGQNSRGVKYRPDLGVLRLTNMKAILNEIAFVDNKKDIKDWDENAELKVMGTALAKAAADWLDIPKKKKATTSTKSIETIAKEVIAGKWGNGETRKKKLTAAGYDYNAVQKKVNELLK